MPDTLFLFVHRSHYHYIVNGWIGGSTASGGKGGQYSSVPVFLLFFFLLFLFTSVSSFFTDNRWCAKQRTTSSDLNLCGHLLGRWEDGCLQKRCPFLFQCMREPQANIFNCLVQALGFCTEHRYRHHAGCYSTAFWSSVSSISELALIILALRARPWRCTLQVDGPKCESLDKHLCKNMADLKKDVIKTKKFYAKSSLILSGRRREEHNGRIAGKIARKNDNGLICFLSSK